MKAGAPACPECGSDSQTGWADGADRWAADIPTGYGRDDEFDYDEFVRREFGAPGRRLLGIPCGRLLVVALAVACALLLALLLLAR